MTCIAGIATEQGVTIGGDSAGVGGLSLTIRADSKVFRTGAYVMGFTTSFRMGQILRYSLDPREPDCWDVDRFMATTFVDRVRDCLRDAGWLGQRDQRDEGGTFLVGTGTHLYAVYGDFQIERAADEYNAVGCGAEIAKGSLHSTVDRDLAPVERIEKALAAAAHHSAGVCAPFVMEATA